MKKVTLIISALIILTGFSTSFADNTVEGVAKTVTISGKVIDKTDNETLAGALILIEGTDIETYTDFDGNFTISGILPDKYTIKCLMISYNEYEEEIEIDQFTENIKFQLENLNTSNSAR
jgi:predicted small secreted protein